MLKYRQKRRLRRMVRRVTDDPAQRRYLLERMQPVFRRSVLQPPSMQEMFAEEIRAEREKASRAKQDTASSD